MKAIRLLWCLFTMILVLGCEEGLDYKYFDVKDESSLNQTVYAGDTQAPMPIEFTASGAWTSKIEYSTNGSASVRTDVSSSGWITLDPDSGDEAGDYSVNIYLDPEKGRDVYRAIISFICNGEVMEVTLENSNTSDPGDDEDIYNPEKIQEAMQKLESGFITAQAQEFYYNIDEDYPTSESRKSLNSKSALLNDMWLESYRAINTCNLLFAACDNEMFVEQERERIMGLAYMYRGLLNLHLATVFGGVPIDTQYPAVSDLPQARMEEVLDFVRSDSEYAINYINKSDARFINACFNNILALVLREGAFDFPEIVEFSNMIIESGLLEFDSNGDYLINEDDSHIGVQTYLIYAYAVSSYDPQRALQSLNYLAELLRNDSFRLEGDVTPDAVKQKVVDILSSSWNRGIKYYVNRFMKHEDWGYLNLLPIPHEAMDSNANLMQNPGWE